MSSACVCHNDEWCFYCEMFVPLEQENELLKAEIEGLKKWKGVAEKSLRQIQVISTLPISPLTDAAIRKSIEEGNRHETKSGNNS